MKLFSQKAHSKVPKMTLAPKKKVLCVFVQFYYQERKKESIVQQ